MKHLKKKTTQVASVSHGGGGEEVSGEQWEGGRVCALGATGQAHCLQLRKHPQDEKEVLGAWWSPQELSTTAAAACQAQVHSKPGVFAGLSRARC